ncbi:MAG: DUF1700 domain-containing protein [Firmicutes bacterium]|nr:DUF1700 domain-containing protein [Bacillota bacterium]
MNRTEFMNQLARLLQTISDAEREEALQYYNDYFDDAGAENEQSVVEALGDPARVAENIRREFLENQAAVSSTAADRAVIEYGKENVRGETGEAPAVPEIGESRDAGRGFNGSRGPDGDPGADGSRNSGGSGSFAGGGGAGGRPGSPGKQGMSGGMIVLITILMVFASPFIIGLLSMLFGLLVMWFALILSFGVVVLSMFIVLFVLLIVGGMCIPADPLVGMALIGGGFVCGGVGILFLMLTVAMAGIVTPAIFRGIGHLFRLGRKEAAA